MARKPATDRARVIGFRYRDSRREMLEIIQRRDGHADISDLIRAIVDEYIDRHLLRRDVVA